MIAETKWQKQAPEADEDPKCSRSLMYISVKQACEGRGGSQEQWKFVAEHNNGSPQ